MRILFLSEFSVCCHLKFLLLWQRDVATSYLYLVLLWSDIDPATDSDGVPHVDPNIDFMYRERGRPESDATCLRHN